MKIAGIYPQKIGADCKIQHAVSEPYGLEMVLAIAKEEGHEVDLFTPAKLIGEQIVDISEEELIERILEFKPDIAAFSLYTCQYPVGKRIARALKKRLPNVINVAGNRYPTFLKLVEEPFDFFVLKEGEETFRELLRKIDKGQTYEDVKGLSFMKNGTPVFTPPRERKFNLDLLPTALRFPVITKQIYKGVSLPPASSNPNYAIMEYSRCCYNNCKFCDNEGFWGNKVVFRSKERVVDEMLELKKQGVSIFYFMDLNFTSFPEKTRELCEEMLSRGLNASWYCMSNVSTVDSSEGRELLTLMKEAGCFKIAWGVESTSDTALRKMNKRAGKNFTTNEQTIRVLQSSSDAGIVTQGFYIIGFPWETSDSILKDSEKLRDIPMHLLNIGIFTPIPLSRFYKEMNGMDYILDTDLEKHDRNHLVYNHETLTDESIKKLQQEIYDSFYSDSEYITRIKIICQIDPRLKQAFNDYFELLGKKVRI